MDKIQEYLLEHNIKPSQQRIEVMKYLMTHHTHPSADDVYNDLSKTMPTLSKTTVYNTLNLLAEQGACTVLSFDEPSLRYDAQMEFHAHFRCKHCGKIIDTGIVSVPSASGLDGFKITDTQIYYSGYCPECNKTK